MSSTIGRALRLQIFGESHGAAVGAVLDGLPAGLTIDVGALEAFVQRRAAKGSAIATGRRESDVPRILSGLLSGVTTGQPLCAVFENADTHSSDYSFLPDCPRPGHADYPALVKSAGHDDLRGSGHHSGRLTLPYVFAGGVAVQLLQKLGVRVGAHALRVGGVCDIALDPVNPDMDALEACHAREVPTLDALAGDQMRKAILAAKSKGNSVGGVIEVAASGMPAGVGAPFFDGVEAVAGQHFFSIPAVKGVEFGAGFGAADMRGSEYNDPYFMQGGQVAALRNSAGGLLGGLTDGMPILARVAFRPTASISMPQQSVSLSGKEARELTVRGRHDPCVAVRAIPVVESALALALCELWLQRRGDQPWEETNASEK
ncbi:MAG: chorismate synthase [Eubacteriales bacterium]|nr:chorismate synthase [Eubacteriales bacterium]